MRNPAFSRLNDGRLNLETVKQTKYRVASLLKILRNCPFGGSRSPTRPKTGDLGWNCSKFRGVWLIAEIAGFVIQITVLAGELMQYPLGKSLPKTAQVLGFYPIHQTTSKYFSNASWWRSIRMRAL